MPTTEIRVRPLNRRRALLIVVAALAAFYFFFGYLPAVLWITGIVFLIAFVINAFQGKSTDARVVLNDEGVFDSRLKVGVIRWTDIKRIKLYSLHGAEYISLELHDSRPYEARRPLWLRILSNFQRVFGMSSIAISTTGLDMDTESLMHRLHSGCQTNYQTTTTRSES